MTAEAKKKTLINILYFSVISVLTYVVLKYLFVYFLPFVFAFVFAAFANFLINRVFIGGNKNKRLYSILFVIIVYLAFFCLLALAGMELADRIREKPPNLYEIYEKDIHPLFNSVESWLNRISDSASSSLGQKTLSMFGLLKENAGNALLSLTGKTIGHLTDFVKKIPGFFIGMFFSIIASLLIVWDYEKIKAFIYKQLGEKSKNIITKLRTILVNSVWKLLKAYFFIMIITFAELSAGFALLKIEQPVLKAVVIAFADFLPMIGVSIILIPWIIICLLQKNFYLAIGLSVLLLVVTVVRNFIEPKVVGVQVGLNPVVSLICFYVGLSLFGILGVFMLPIIVITLKSLNDEGLIKLWKS